MNKKWCSFGSVSVLSKPINKKSDIVWSMEPDAEMAMFDTEQDAITSAKHQLDEIINILKNDLAFLDDMIDKDGLTEKQPITFSEFVCSKCSLEDVQLWRDTTIKNIKKVNKAIAILNS